MLTSTDRDDLHKIVILNPKGGCGKTTLATNLASYYALRGPAPTLMDCDSQGFSMRWLDHRPDNRPEVHGICAHEHVANITESLNLDVSSNTKTVIFDLPGAVGYDQIHELTYDAGSILIPIMPSAIDVYSASRFIAELLLATQLDRRSRKLAVVANRTRQKTKSFQMLTRFLTSLRIPLISVLRDSQNYVYAAGKGIGICELPAYRAGKDIAQFELIVNWLDQWRMRQLDAAASPEFEHVPGSQVLTPAYYKDRN
jgi:chromosome partitioning protein